MFPSFQAKKFGEMQFLLTYQFKAVWLLLLLSLMLLPFGPSAEPAELRLSFVKGIFGLFVLPPQRCNNADRRPGGANGRMEPIIIDQLLNVQGSGEEGGGGDRGVHFFFI